MKRSTFLFFSLVFLLLTFALYALGVLSRDITHKIDHYQLTETVMYSGEFRDGLFNGTGTIDLGNGFIYEGDFKAGRFEGKGILRFTGESPDQNWHFEGAFQEGLAISGDFVLSDGRVVPMTQAPTTQ